MPKTPQAPAPPSYAAAKAALVSFTRSWALELAAGGITVNAVSPGPTETALFRANNPVGSESEARSLFGVPMGRFGRPEEVAGAIEFLLSMTLGLLRGGRFMSMAGPQSASLRCRFIAVYLEAVSADPRLQSIRAARPLRRVALL
ncbi:MULTISPECIES: SDR family oxidoreductase [Alphaproteobacteria]|uniref:SDR family oxidoreductase n=1 Tax=Alphaproteobacteria TaxID=28211 RepID=UPI002547EA08|nr:MULTISPECIES: SDR family oxidoreductase [Alphaproteobacteria]